MRGKSFFKVALIRSFFSSWCKILRVEKLQQIVVVVVNGVTDDLKDTEEFQGWKQIFTSVRKYSNTNKIQ